MGQMSYDRVKFRIPGRSSGDSSKHYLPALAALRAAFGMDERTYRSKSGSGYRDVEIICRPSQFARFMIKRNDAGGSNGFRELKPELFQPEPACDEPVDVSRARNTYYEDE
jgi:hypothetical protein